MGYVAACSLSTQTTLATLDMQSGTLTPSSAQTVSQLWKLWSPSTEEAISLLTDASLSSLIFIVMMTYFDSSMWCFTKLHLEFVQKINL